MSRELFRRVGPVVGLIVALASLYFFYRGVAFLATQDYVAALLTIFVGFALLRGGVEIARVAHHREGGGDE